MAHSRGTKRTCQSCEERFYDLDRDPIVCPFCASKYVVPSTAGLALEQREKAATKPKQAIVGEPEEELPAGEELALDDVESEEAPRAEEAILTEEDGEEAD